MAKQDQIRISLKDVNDTKFQRLSEEILSKLGYENINPIGIAKNSEKPKPGTPDTLVSLDNGKYLFAEHTTDQGSSLKKKIREDIEKCLDESKTKIPLKDIESIYYFYNSNLDSDFEYQVRKLCADNSIRLETYNLERLVRVLHDRFPTVAKDHFGIQIDSGQIMSTSEFISSYAKSNLATPLTTSFQFREQEFEEALNALNSENVLVISGPPGCGKTRFALELLDKKSKSDSSLKTWCVLNSGGEIFDDVKYRFSDEGKYMILVDDANRLGGRLGYFLDLMRKSDENHRATIIITVRDYAEKNVRELVDEYTQHHALTLEPLTDDQIREFVEKEFGILNNRYKDRIADISGGNPRLAVMASQVSLEGGFDRITDVLVLYDEYFGRVENIRLVLKNKILSLTAGIVAFYRFVDKSNQDQMQEINQIFNITEDVFWENVKTLHANEVVDLHENDIVKISDQVIATYLFYDCFFRKENFSFSKLLSNFGVSKIQLLVDSVIPAANAFDSAGIKEKIKKDVSTLLDEISLSESDSLKLIDGFSWVIPTKSLKYIQEKIFSKPIPNFDWEKAEFKSNTGGSHSGTILQNLCRLNRYGTSEMKMSCHLLLEYIKRNPSNLDKALNDLCHSFSYNTYDFDIGFILQKELSDLLWESAKSGDDYLFTRCFIFYATSLLKARHETTTTKGNTLNIKTFTLPFPNKYLDPIREKTWERLAELYTHEKYKDDVYSFLYDYDKNFWQVSNEFKKNELQLIGRFIFPLFSQDSLKDCLLACKYVEFDCQCKFDILSQWKDSFETDDLLLYRILITDHSERRSLKLDFREFQEYKQKEISELVKDLTPEQMLALLKRCEKVINKVASEPNKNTYQLKRTITDLIVEYSKLQPDSFLDFVELFFRDGSKIKFEAIDIVICLAEIGGFEETLKFIEENEFIDKNFWKLQYYIIKADKEPVKDDIETIEDLLNEAKPEDFPINHQFLIKYLPFDSTLMIRVVRMILSKLDKNERYFNFLRYIFRYEYKLSDIEEMLSNNLDLIKEVYILVSKLEGDFDHDGKFLEGICEKAPEFIFEFIDSKLNANDDLYREEMPIFDWLWLREDYFEYFQKIFTKLQPEVKRGSLYTGCMTFKFFGVQEGNQNKKLILNRQAETILHLVKAYAEDINIINSLLDLIHQTNIVSLEKVIEVFIFENDSIEAFSSLHIEAFSSSYSGSMVPTLVSEREELEKLLPLVEEPKFFDHRIYIKKRIDWKNEQIDREKKEDFVQGH